MSSVLELTTKNGKPRHRGKVRVPTITLAHGGGGKAMHDLIDDIFLEVFDNETQAPLEDQARLSLGLGGIWRSTCFYHRFLRGQAPRFSRWQYRQTGNLRHG